jgi:hypothetical protein
MKKMLLMALAAMSLVAGVSARNCGESCSPCKKPAKVCAPACAPAPKCVRIRTVEECVPAVKTVNCPTYACPVGTEQR